MNRTEFCGITAHHVTGNYFWGNCGQNCPHTTAMARLDKCLNKDMMPYYGSEEWVTPFLNKDPVQKMNGLFWIRN